MRYSHSRLATLRDPSTLPAMDLGEQPGFRARRPRVFLAPFLDVLLFLLVVLVLFLLSWNRRSSPAHVENAATETGAPHGHGRDVRLIVAIDAEGGTWVDGEAVSEPALFTRLEGLRAEAEGAELRVILSIDRRATFEHATRLMNELKRRLPGQISIETKRG